MRYAPRVATCPTCQRRFEQAMFCPRDGARLVEDARMLGGRYRLGRKVGEGAMGEVFEAEHVTLGRRVAVKLLRPLIASEAAAIARLQREAQSTSTLGHPNIVSVLDFGESDEGRAFLVMEWLDGENLDDFLASTRANVALALDIATQICAGLAEAHDQGVIHRDLKPANLFVTRDRRGVLVVKILDFGIAKLARDQPRLTGTGVVIGTPNYMVPEQASGDPIDARTDVYALGVILYEMLTGALPFRSESSLGVLHQHATVSPEPPSTAAADRGITPALDALVLRCLAKPPEARFADMSELGAALAAVRAGRDWGGPPGIVARPRSAPSAGDSTDALPATRGSRRAVRGAISAALVLTLGGGALVVWRHLRHDAAPHAHDEEAAGVVPALAVDAASPDAIEVDAGVAWSTRRAGKRFEARAWIGSALPIAGLPFELEIVVAPIDPTRAGAELPDAGHVHLTTYSSHAVLLEASYQLAPDGRLVVPLTLPRDGKYHLRLSLTRQARRLEELTIDLTAGAPGR